MRRIGAIVLFLMAGCAAAVRQCPPPQERLEYGEAVYAVGYDRLFAAVQEGFRRQGYGIDEADPVLGGIVTEWEVLFLTTAPGSGQIRKRFTAKVEPLDAESTKVTLDYFEQEYVSFDGGWRPVIITVDRAAYLYRQVFDSVYDALNAPGQGGGPARDGS